jgi:ABC-type Fe3+/spermidine/putrescine transport system ATPase subunit
MTAAPGALEIAVRVGRGDFDVAADLRIDPGERLALFGPSGAGKTTLLETIAGLVDPHSGAVRLGDEVLSRPAHAGTSRRRAPALSRRIGGIAPPRAAVEHVSLVRQPPGLFPHLDVEQNIGYGRAVPALVATTMERLGLLAHRRARPRALSGGQAQRVAVARALARRFSVLLLDEPLSGLDPATRAICSELVRERCAEEGSAAVLVTHDLAEAQAFGDRMAVVDEGVVLALGNPHDVVASPGSRRVAEVVGYEAFLDLREVGGAGHLELAFDSRTLQLSTGEAAALGVAGRVASCVPSGAGYLLALEVPAETEVRTEIEGRWVSASAARLPLVVTNDVPVGKEILAAAAALPVVAGSQSVDLGRRSV